MRIGVISDSHDDINAIKRVINKAGEVDAWIHCGDYSSDAVRMAELTDKPIYSVRGNCDDRTSNAPLNMVVELGGKRIYATHGHVEDVNSGTSGLINAALRKECDIAVYGHTHLPNVEYAKVLVLNPGSPSIPLGGNAPSYAVITIDGDKVDLSIFNIESLFDRL